MMTLYKKKYKEVIMCPKKQGEFPYCLCPFGCLADTGFRQK